mgnify:CR=1 FL=1
MKLFNKVEEVAKPFLVISETATSTWHYHFRLVGPEGAAALCGAKLGWDTTMPLSTWGLKDHIPSRYCGTCEKEARARGLWAG